MQNYLRKKIIITNNIKYLLDKNKYIVSTKINNNMNTQNNDVLYTLQPEVSSYLHFIFLSFFFFFVDAFFCIYIFFFLHS